jgi:hypothetical protein
MAIKKASLFMLTTPLLLGAANASGNMGGSPDWWQVDDASEGTEACVQVSYGPMGSFDPVTTQSGMRGSFSVAKKATQMYLADSMLQTEEDQEILSVCNANITDVMRTVVVTEACEQNGSEENKYVVESSFTVPCSEEDMAILPDGTELTRRILTNGSKNMSMKGMAQGPQIDRVEGVMELEEDDGEETSDLLDDGSMETSRKLLHGDNGEEKKRQKGKKNGEKKRNATKKDGEKKRNGKNNGQEGSSRKLLHNKNGEKKGQGDKNGEGDGEKKQYGKNGEKGGDGEQQGEKKQYGKNGEKKGDGDKNCDDDGEKKRNGKNNGQESSSRKLLHNKNGEKKGQGDKNGEGEGERKQYGKNGEKRGDGEQQGEKKQYGKNQKQ